jgi:hypothetical protein
MLHNHKIRDVIDTITSKAVRPFNLGGYFFQTALASIEA